MAADYVIFIGWNRAVSGREKVALDLFKQAQAYFGDVKASGQIAGFETVLLWTHGGDLNGFTLIKGEEAKLDALQHSDRFQDLIVKVSVNVAGTGVIRGWSGESMMKQVQRYANVI